MADAGWVREQAAVSLGRLWPRIEAQLRDTAAPGTWRAFEARLRREWERLFGLLVELYGGNYDFFYHLEELVAAAARSWLARPGWLKELDARCEAPEGESDGGYAVSSYRHVNPKLGTIDELAEIAREFQAHGISLVVDFVFNHTSDEHAWARAAQAGDPEYEQFYLFFPDRTIPDAYERTLRAIFPTVR